MASGLIRMIPMGAVAGMAAYCLSPFLGHGPSMMAEAEKQETPRIETELISPSLNAAPPRNPFEVVATAISNSTAPGAAARAAVEEAPKGPALPEEMHVGATLVHGRRRAAIVNGKVYAEGDEVPAPDAEQAVAANPEGESEEPSAPRTFKMIRVEHDRVWFEVVHGNDRVPIALACTARKKNEPGQAPGDDPGEAGPAPAFEPGSAEHLKALADSAQYNAVMGLAQKLLGGAITPPMAAGKPGRSVVPPLSPAAALGGLNLGQLGLGMPTAAGREGDQ